MNECVVWSPGGSRGEERKVAVSEQDGVWKQAKGKRKPQVPDFESQRSASHKQTPSALASAGAAPCKVLSSPLLPFLISLCDRTGPSR